MNTAREAYGTGYKIDSIYNELNELEKHYGTFLRQEFLNEEIGELKNLIEEYRKGSPEAAEHLKKHGADTLHTIREKLTMAAAEQERIIEESPSQTEATGKKSHEASRAAAIALDAESNLEDAVKEFNPHDQ